MRLFPYLATPHFPECIPKAEQLLHHSQQVQVVPFLSPEVPSDQFGYSVEESFVPVGWMTGKQLKQRHKVITRVLLQKGV